MPLMIKLRFSCIWHTVINAKTWEEKLNAVPPKYRRRPHTYCWKRLCRKSPECSEVRNVEISETCGKAQKNRLTPHIKQKPPIMNAKNHGIFSLYTEEKWIQGISLLINNSAGTFINMLMYMYIYKYEIIGSSQ